MKKSDLMLLATVLLLCAGMFLLNRFVFHKAGSHIKVMVDGQLYGEYSLLEDREISIVSKDGRTDILKISHGQAKMISADCPDKLCTHQQAISRGGETIVCLPLKIVVEVDSDEKPKADAVAQ